MVRCQGATAVGTSRRLLTPNHGRHPPCNTIAITATARLGRTHSPRDCNHNRSDPLRSNCPTPPPRLHPLRGEAPGLEGAEFGRETVAATASNRGNLHPQFLGYSLHVCGYQVHTLAIESNGRGRPLTCPIPKCPVSSKQFTKLHLAAFQVICHLHKGTER